MIEAGNWLDLLQLGPKGTGSRPQLARAHGASVKKHDAADAGEGNAKLHCHLGCRESPRHNDAVVLTSRAMAMNLRAEVEHGHAVIKPCCRDGRR